MESSTDRSTQAKAFDETKTGVKGLVDSGITKIPSMFHASPVTLASMQAPPPPHHKQLTIPTIDLKGVSVDMTKRRNVVEKMGEAAEKWGFFQVVNHGIPEDVLERMIEGTRGFHEQDPEAKKKFYTRDYARKFHYTSNFDVLTSPGGWRDSLACYTAPDPPSLDELPPIFGEIMMEYSKKMMNLGELLFELLSEALGLSPNHLKDMDCTKFQVMFGQYYPPCPEPNLTLGIYKHTDFSFITILLQDKIGGLQVLHDQYWIDVPHVPGALVINIGDLLQFISVEHRVIANRSIKPRISVICFFSTFMKENPQVYGPIKELLSEQNPAKYRDITLTEFSNMFRSSVVIDTPPLPHFKM
ncbi:1-aminocyclopropane-1-carboxylate oxidase homolog 5 isoform X1 [Capsella rubella]|uniref:1-aminocyclopropane-1-carboxylate oxidase homolog 5 isoform X1 n=1 Tax=Capsella rubella TaxID=81985 RepID=UPI000CD4B639|nr:1-aminocyclopropane-1-carboxylate oxidase homolog 5 isoform X1 [Capsella rubella]